MTTTEEALELAARTAGMAPYTTYYKMGRMIEALVSERDEAQRQSAARLETIATHERWREHSNSTIDEAEAKLARVEAEAQAWADSPRGENAPTQGVGVHFLSILAQPSHDRV
jgi:hypothetical protein